MYKLKTKTTHGYAMLSLCILWSIPSLNAASNLLREVQSNPIQPFGNIKFAEHPAIVFRKLLRIKSARDIRVLVKHGISQKEYRVRNIKDFYRAVKPGTQQKTNRRRKTSGTDDRQGRGRRLGTFQSPLRQKRLNSFNESTSGQPLYRSNRFSFIVRSIYIGGVPFNAQFKFKYNPGLVALKQPGIRFRNGHFPYFLEKVELASNSVTLRTNSQRVVAAFRSKYAKMKAGAHNARASNDLNALLVRQRTQEEQSQARDRRKRQHVLNSRRSGRTKQRQLQQIDRNKRRRYARYRKDQQRLRARNNRRAPGKREQRRLAKFNKFADRKNSRGGFSQADRRQRISMLGRFAILGPRMRGVGNGANEIKLVCKSNYCGASYIMTRRFHKIVRDLHNRSVAKKINRRIKHSPNTQDVNL